VFRIFFGTEMIRRIWIVVLVVGVGLFTWSCAGPTRPVGKEPARPRYVERGIASWYGDEFHGNPTASGEIYDMYQLTAAHKTLPLGTSVMVTNLENRRFVRVRINDRGPFVKGRIIDLSYEAARVIGMAEKGTARVEVVAFGVTDRLLDEDPVYAVQVGSFRDRKNAESLLRQLQRVSAGAYMTVLETNQGNYYRVRVGRFDTREMARQAAEKLVSLGYSVLITSR